MREIKITDRISGGRLDKMLIKYLDKSQRGFIFKMLRKKNIVLNGKKASGSEILKSGDVVTLYLSDDTIEKFRSPEKAVKPSPQNRIRSMIIYEDDNILAVNKPSGLLSQKGAGNDVCMNDMIVQYLGKDDLFTPGISNRLDRNTSGIILAGKDPGNVRLLNEAIRSRQISKLYLAAVSGRFLHDTVYEGYITKDHDLNRSAVFHDLKDAESAQGRILPVKTAVHPVSCNSRCSLLQIDLLTGRSHQIRAQLSSAGFGIIGDAKYGDPVLNESFRRRYGVRSQLLHAHRITFHDMTGKLEYLNHTVITADIPEVFLRTVQGEGLCLPGDQED